MVCRCVDLYSGGFSGAVSQVDMLLFDLDNDPYERYNINAPSSYAP